MWESLISNQFKNYKIKRIISIYNELTIKKKKKQNLKITSLKMHVYPKNLEVRTSKSYNRHRISIYIDVKS